MGILRRLFGRKYVPLPEVPSEQNKKPPDTCAKRRLRLTYRIGLFSVFLGVQPCAAIRPFRPSQLVGQWRVTSSRDAPEGNKKSPSGASLHSTDLLDQDNGVPEPSGRLNWSSPGAPSHALGPKYVPTGHAITGRGFSVA